MAMQPFDCVNRLARQGLRTWCGLDKLSLRVSLYGSRMPKDVYIDIIPAAGQYYPHQ